MAVTKDGMVVETEVKVTMQDLKRDKGKTKHLTMERELDMFEGRESEHPYLPASTRSNYFYFAVPQEMEAKACSWSVPMTSISGIAAIISWHRSIRSGRLIGSPNSG